MVAAVATVVREETARSGKASMAETPHWAAARVAVAQGLSDPTHPDPLAAQAAMERYRASPDPTRLMEAVAAVERQAMELADQGAQAAVARAAPVPLVTAWPERPTRVVAAVAQQETPVAALVSFAEKAIEFEIQVSISQPEIGTGMIRSAILRNVWQLFRDNGVALAVPPEQMRPQ